MALLVTCQLFAQSKLTGTVIGEDDNEPLMGATVKVAGTGTGTVTDLDGRFTISLPQGKSRITVSYVGYKPETVNVSGKQHVDIVLKSDAASMNEVVVVG